MVSNPQNKNHLYLLVSTNDRAQINVYTSLSLSGMWKNNSYFLGIKPILRKDLIKILFGYIYIVPALKGEVKYGEINM